MGEPEEGLSSKQAREKLDELSLRDFLETGDFEIVGVPEEERERGKTI